MSLHHLFLEDQVIAEEAESVFQLMFSPVDAKHIKALRLEPGEHISVVDAAQDYFELEIVEIDNTGVKARIAQHLDAPQSSIPVALVQGLAKSDKLDTVLRAATELGISDFYPAEMNRSVVKLDTKKAEKRVERLKAIARSAAMQSGRTTIPEVHTLEPLSKIVSSWTDSDAVLLFWEEADPGNTIRSVFADLQRAGDLSSIKKFWIIIGPEGGIDPSEVELIENSNAQVFKLSLGPIILRTETAGIVAPALVMNELQGLANRGE